MLTHLNAKLPDLAQDLLDENNSGVKYDKDKNVLYSKGFRFGFNEKDSRKFADALKLGIALQDIIPSIKKVWIEDKWIMFALAFKVDLKRIELDLNEFLDNGALRDRLFYRDTNGSVFFNKMREMRPKQIAAEYFKIFTDVVSLAIITGKADEDYFLVPYSKLRKEMERQKIFGKLSHDFVKYSDEKFKEKIRNFVKQFKRWPHNFGLPKGQDTFNKIQILQTNKDGVKFYNPQV